MKIYRGVRFAGYNNPKATPEASKKSAVLAKEGGKVRLVRFGDPNMPIKKHIAANRKSFRARHGCDNPGSKLKARVFVKDASGRSIQSQNRVVIPAGWYALPK